MRSFVTAHPERNLPPAEAAQPSEDDELDASVEAEQLLSLLHDSLNALASAAIAKY